MEGDKLESLVERYMQMTRGAAAMAVMAVADRTGLLKYLATSGPVTVAVIHETLGLQKRLTEEVLNALVALEFLDYDAPTRCFSMSPECAAVTADETSSSFLGGWSQIAPSLHRVIPHVVAACRDGGGVDYANYGQEMINGMRRASAPELRRHLVPDWLARVPGLVARLESGIQVADIGCGCGDAGRLIAKAFPASHVTGYDTSRASIDLAQELATADELENIEFKLIGQSGFERSVRFDFAIAIDVIHDVAHPSETLANIGRSLNKGGSFLMAEPSAGDTLEENIGKSGALLYSMSAMHCTPISLAEGGVGVGAAWGSARARQAAHEAGFRSFERLPIENYYNAFYLLSDHQEKQP